MNPTTTKRNQSSTGRRRCDPNLSYTFRKTYKERKQAIQRTNFLRKKKRRGPTPWSEANTPSSSSSSYHRHIKEQNRSFSSSNLHQKGSKKFPFQHQWQGKRGIITQRSHSINRAENLKIVPFAKEPTDNQRNDHKKRPLYRGLRLSISQWKGENYGRRSRRGKITKGKY